MVENFENCVFFPYQQYSVSKTNDEKQSDRRQSKQRHETQSRGKSSYTQLGSAVHQDSTRWDNNSNFQSLSAVYNQGGTSSDYNGVDHYYQRPAERTEFAAERCMKCGLTNHVTLDCFHQKQV